jgi:hypothetical protein
MADPVLERLLKRRAALIAEVRRTEAKFHDLFVDIDNLDGTILQFDPNYKVINPAVRGVGLTGQLTRSLLGILRKSPEPMTLRDLTVAMMASLGLDYQDPKRVSRMMEQTRNAMIRQKKNGTAVSEQGPARALLWRIAG